MKDEDEICAFDCSVRQSMRSKLECSSPLDPVDVHDNEISRAYTFDELEDRTTNGFAQVLCAFSWFVLHHIIKLMYSLANLLRARFYMSCNFTNFTAQGFTFSFMYMVK